MRAKPGRAKGGVWAVLLFSLLVGFLIRIDDMRLWQSKPEVYFYDHKPIPLNSDGYKYLCYARELMRGTYEPLDKYRNAPDGYRPPAPQSGASRLLAVCAAATGLSLEWPAFWLPPLLSLIMAWPLYLLGRFYSGPAMGLCAVFAGLTSIMYAGRTYLGMYDTDFLIPAGFLAGAWFSLKFGMEKQPVRYLWFAAALLSGLLLWYWWDQARFVVAFFFILSPLTALALHYRPARKEGLIFFSILGLILCGTLIFFGREIWAYMVDQAGFFIDITTKKHMGEFPSPLYYVDEMQRPRLAEVVEYSTGNPVVLLLGMGGTALLFFRRVKTALYLLPLVVLFGLSFFLSIRFLIFAAPVIGLGLGYLAAKGWELRGKHKSLAAVVPLAVLLCGVPSGLAFWGHSPDVRLNQYVGGLDFIRENTPKDCIVWTSWTLGHHVNYWAERRQVQDGETFTDPKRIFFTCLPLADRDPRFAANYMAFFSARGLAGVEKIRSAVGGGWKECVGLVRDGLSGGPEGLAAALKKFSPEPVPGLSNAKEWAEFLYPPARPEIYLFLHQDMASRESWYFSGMWDFDEKNMRSNPYRIFSPANRTDADTIQGPDLLLDLKSGTARIDGDLLHPLSFFVESSGGGVRRKTYNSGESGFAFNPSRSYGLLAMNQGTNTLFWKLFGLGQSDQRYFRPIRDNTPSYRIWRVTSDALP